MTEPFYTAVRVRQMLEFMLSRAREFDTPVVAAVFSITVEIDGVGPVNVSASYPADDAQAAIELAESTAEVMREALG